jgi:hypothetical protein
LISIRIRVSLLALLVVALAAGWQPSVGRAATVALSTVSVELY